MFNLTVICMLFLKIVFLLDLIKCPGSFDAIFLFLKKDNIIIIYK